MKTRIVSVLAAAAIVLSVTACSSEPAVSFAEAETPTETQVIIPETEMQEISTETEAEAEEAKAPDLSNPDVIIELGDYDAMKDLCTKIANFEMIGSVVKITGISQKRTSTCTLTEKNDKGESIGYTYKIDGKVFPVDYPDSDTTITITAEVCQEGLDRYFKVLPENFSIVE